MRQTATIIIALTVILDVLDIVTVGLRIYCRISKRLGMGADDWCLIAGLVCLADDLCLFKLTEIDSLDWAQYSVRLCCKRHRSWGPDIRANAR